MASWRAAIVFSLLCLAIQRVGTLQLNITPPHAHLDQSGDTITVMCHSDEPITKCQFNFVKDEKTWEGPSLELSKGAMTKINPLLLSNAITSYGYSGSGLKNGHCGVTLNLTGPKMWIVGCRVQTRNIGWKYAIMSIVADNTSHIPITVTPRSIVVLAGRSAGLLCKPEGPLQSCRIKPPGSGGRPFNFDEGSDSSDSTNSHSYYGTGVESGECGISFSGITQGYNGYVFCDLITKQGYSGGAGIPFVVARRPDQPILTIRNNSLSAGSELEASCTVHGGRPVANITWYLGNKILRHDDDDNSYDQVWRWPTSQQRITQVFSRKLEPTDDGQELRCEADHVTLSQPMLAKTVIKVKNTGTIRTDVPYGNGVIATVPPKISSTVKPVLIHSRGEPQQGCPPLISETVQINCSLAEEEVDCSKPMPVATIAVLACKPGFVEQSSINYLKITCRKGNMWSREVYNCIPDCGRRNRNGLTELISLGNYSKVAEFPWHVGIYKISSINTEQLCGGSIISPNIVISAAHCIWNNTKGSAYPASMFKMAAGKLYRSWDAGDSAVQRRDVEQVIPHRLYRGRIANFVADIVLLKPVTPFHINDRVNVICIDWRKLFLHNQLVEGNLGVVAGWGLTENNIASDVLKYIDLPYIPPVTCLDSLKPELQSVWSPDRLCAGFVNKSMSVCPGDSGGGLVFLNPYSDKYYL